MLGIVLILAACSAQAGVKAVEKPDPTAVADIAPTTTAAPAVVASTTSAQNHVALAGDYGFAHVQVSEVPAGDFEVRTRATNNGGSKGFVGMSVTLFLDGSVVGVADASVSD